MSRKLLLTLSSTLAVIALMLIFGAIQVHGQGGEGEDPFERIPLVTTASRSVGIGTYVAAEGYGVAAGADPAEQPAVAMIMPYSIYPNMMIEDVKDFVQPDPAVEGFTFEWSLAAPEGSTSELIQGTVAIFLADVEGKYDLTLTITDPNSNTAETTWTVFASTYIGVGGLMADPPMYPQCGTCHADKGKAWYQTAHATMFTRSIDGLTSDHYNGNCISCHTTGFNNWPEAVNGGFDDVAREAGWTFPEVLEPGNWAALTEEYPEVAAMANIQCESCHGPGQLHVAGGVNGDKAISLGLDYGVCAQCHAEEPYHVFPIQWEQSAHADKNARAFWYPVGEDHIECVRCHSGAGFIDASAGLPQEQWRTEYQVITCAVCHDPHNAENPNQLRVFDSVMLPDGTEVADAGAAATCMACHNARVDAVSSVEGVAEGGSFSTPHYSTAGELMNGTGGYTWGATLPSSPHGKVLEDSCISCHMAATPGTDEEGNSLPGHNEVGQHTFAMVGADGYENVAVCQSCHTDATTFDFDAFRDYDGNGEVESNQAEIAGLQALLQEQLTAAGVAVLESYPYFTIPEDATTDVYGAVWNLKFSQGGGSAIHNLKYTVALLQLSYEKLAGETVPNAYLLTVQE